MNAPAKRWEFWVDRGGTFTDVIGIGPDGSLHTAKVLSSTRAPVEGIRAIAARALGIGPTDALPPCTVKLGTTVATNALLERRGVATGVVTQRGLADVFAIGTQERPELFELAIHKPLPLHRACVEAAGRVGADGEPVEEPDLDALRVALGELREEGIESLAIVSLHGAAYPELETRWVQAAEGLGFAYVVTSHDAVREQGFLARGETTIADAYLTPLLQSHSHELAAALPQAQLRFMQSSGGLTDAARFRGPRALLSGPAGGVVGAAAVAAAAGYTRALGFDMGGTSTDVSLIVDGEVDRAFETQVAGIRVRAPMLRIHTVAAGGGSLCRFDGFRLTVGPESAGADPGPLCYGHAEARELAITDINLFLGRLLPDRFPFPLDRARVERALDSLHSQLATAGHPLEPDAIAAGFVEIANAAMAQAIQQVSVARGVDPRECVLVGFGGAGGQHVCEVARVLGVRRILLHPLAGLLSAYGIGVSPPSWDGEADAGRVPLRSGEALPKQVAELHGELVARGRAALEDEEPGVRALRVELFLDLRYAGTDTALTVAAPDDGDWVAAFEMLHRTRFGYLRPGRALEITTARVRVRGPGARTTLVPPAPGAAAPRERRVEAWFPGVGRVLAPVLPREALGEGAELEGPAILLEETGTVVVDPGFRVRVGARGLLELEDCAVTDRGASHRPNDYARADPIRLEVYGNRFMSVAEQMGAVLRNTAVSTNIKERLDYSCAVFDERGGLVANAPHIPVHLGAMEETIRCLRARFSNPAPGDVFVTNDPFQGGSHLPDVTVVTPVFIPGNDAPAFYVGSRGHHADLGGQTPGSMPADSRSLDEEGVVLEPAYLVRAGEFQEAALRARLTEARYPARNPDDNVADLEAMVAANRQGEHLLQQWSREVGFAALHATMHQLQKAAAAKVAREIAKLRPGAHAFRDELDDGTPVAVTLHVAGEHMTIDFAGTGAAVAGNLNAPPAVVRAAVIYVLRSMVAERIPLNGGCLAPVEIRIPPASLLDPPPGSAVVGGNVETSQRVADVLLGAPGAAAAGQGTMNNVTFGNDRFGYYETIGGGAGAGPGFAGASGVHVHMTNTRITDPEVLESRYPVRLLEFSLRRGSGGRASCLEVGFSRR